MSEERMSMAWNMEQCVRHVCDHVQALRLAV